MDPDPPSLFLVFASDWLAILPSILALLALLISSALISGSEVAFFSLKPADIQSLEEGSARSDKQLIELRNNPKKLLATILISNNLVNIGIVILSSFVIEKLVDFQDNQLLKFLVQVIGITFVLLLFGEVLPKVYASRNSLAFSRLMAIPLRALNWFFSPLSFLLVRSGNFLNRAKRESNSTLSVDDLSQALELTQEPVGGIEEQRILEGIVKFGNTSVKQTMKPRMDVVAIEQSTSYKEVLECILHSGYSRIPVFLETFDQITGILYIKDLLPYIESNVELDWQKMLRKPIFVPEAKKIDDLLQEFREKRIHMAVVVDEFGGTSGIITLEDIIEEIVGDISDEFDDEDLIYSKLDDYTYVFEGKTPLNDFYKVLGIDGELFETKKGESDTLAGFILEIGGRIMAINDSIEFNEFLFVVEAMDNRRIQRIKVSLQNTLEDETEA